MKIWDWMPALSIVLFIILVFWLLYHIGALPMFRYEEKKKGVEKP